jgi:membrane-associated phospholipid phosphatase
MLKQLNVLPNLRRCFSVSNILLQLLAAASTYILVISGFDWYWYTNTQNPTFQKFLFPAIIVGGLLPILLPTALFLAGKISDDSRTLTVSFALMHAGFLGLIISSFYKSLTGRIQPPHYIENIIDTSRGFNFGFFEHGIFWGWPSSHTTVAFAIAITVFILFSSSRIIKYASFMIAFYIGIGVSANIHWFSDFLAGAIIGSVIGYVVGRSFLSKMTNEFDDLHR